MRTAVLTTLIVAIAAAPWPAARADNCSVLQGDSVTQMCGSFVDSHQSTGEFTVDFGPGTTFGVAGVPGTNTSGISGRGTFQCRGNNFYTTQYTTNAGTAPVWYAHLPGPANGYDTETTSVFDIALKSGPCPGQ
jgi:hypothetical protein